MNSYVSFLDILGFGNLIDSNPLELVLKKINNANTLSKFAEVLGAWQNRDGTLYPDLAKKQCLCFSFSDTFVIHTPDTSLESLNVILGATFILSRALFGMGMPVRGAIASGEVGIVPDTQHLIGKGIIKAARLEKSQKWFGIAIDPEVANEKTVPKLDQEVQELLVPYKVPIKDGGELECFVINWRLNLYVRDGTESLFPKPKDKNHKTNKKNALAFAKHLRDSSQSYKKLDKPWLSDFIVGPAMPKDPSKVKKIHGDEY